MCFPQGLGKVEVHRDHLLLSTMPPCHSSMLFYTRQLFLAHYTLRGRNVVPAMGPTTPPDMVVQIQSQSQCPSQYRGVWISSWSHHLNIYINPLHNHNHCVPLSRSHPPLSRPWRRLTRARHRVLNPHYNHCVPLTHSRPPLSRA